MLRQGLSLAAPLAASSEAHRPRELRASLFQTWVGFFLMRVCAWGTQAQRKPLPDMAEPRSFKARTERDSLVCVGPLLFFSALMFSKR